MTWRWQEEEIDEFSLTKIFPDQLLVLFHRIIAAKFKTSTGSLTKCSFISQKYIVAKLKTNIDSLTKNK